jgi:hypothetical protein
MSLTSLYLVIICNMQFMLRILEKIDVGFQTGSGSETN